MLRGGEIFIGMGAEWEIPLVTDTTNFKTRASSHARPALDPITGQDIYIFSFQIPVRLSPRPLRIDFGGHPGVRLIPPPDPIDDWPRRNIEAWKHILNVQLVVCSERFVIQHKQAYKHKSVRTVLPADFLCIMFYNLPQPGFANSKSYFKWLLNPPRGGGQGRAFFWERGSGNSCSEGGRSQRHTYCMWVTWTATNLKQPWCTSFACVKTRKYNCRVLLGSFYCFYCSQALRCPLVI